MSSIPNLETLILWNCHSLVQVPDDITDLKSLALLNMTGCIKLCKSEQTRLLERLVAPTFRRRVVRRGVAEQPAFSFPDSLQRLFLKDCNLDCNGSFPLGFYNQPSLQYLNLGNGRFDSLPRYDHLLKLRVLDLSFCSRLKSLQGLPNTPAELYVYYCISLERITFRSPQFALLEFGFEGCISLSEIEGFIKLVPVTKLEENDLGHMKWLRKYQDEEVCLVGNDELTTGRGTSVQILYEFDIISTSLPYIKDPNIKPEYVSELSSLSFHVPSCPRNRRLKGLDVTFKYTLSGDDDYGWFCKSITTSGVDLMFNPIVFGKPDAGKAGIWLSYWPLGKTLKVKLSIAVMSGVEVHECGVSLVYDDDKVAEEALKDNMGWVETLGGDLSGFKLSTGAYYLCRRDFFKSVEVGRLTPDRFRSLVGDTFDITELRGWRKTGRPDQLNQSFTELKSVRCIIHGPQSEEIYQIAEMSKSSFADNNSKFVSLSSMLDEIKKSATSSKFTDTSTQSTHDQQADGMLEDLLTEDHELVDLASESLQKKDMDRTQGWSPEEDEILPLVRKRGPRNWPLIANSLPSKSENSSTLLPWCNHLSPQTKHRSAQARWKKIARVFSALKAFKKNSTLKRKSSSTTNEDSSSFAIQQPSSKRSDRAASVVTLSDSYLKLGFDVWDSSMPVIPVTRTPTVISDSSMKDVSDVTCVVATESESHESADLHASEKFNPHNSAT